MDNQYITFFNDFENKIKIKMMQVDDEYLNEPTREMMFAQKGQHKLKILLD